MFESRGHQNSPFSPSLIYKSMDVHNPQSNYAAKIWVLQKLSIIRGMSNDILKDKGYNPSEMGATQKFYDTKL